MVARGRILKTLLPVSFLFFLVLSRWCSANFAINIVQQFARILQLCPDSEDQQQLEAVTMTIKNALECHLIKFVAGLRVANYTIFQFSTHYHRLLRLGGNFPLPAHHSQASQFFFLEVTSTLLQKKFQAPEMDFQKKNKKKLFASVMKLRPWFQLFFSHLVHGE